MTDTAPPPPPGRNAVATLADAKRDVAMVTRFLRAGYPAVSPAGNTRSRSAARMAAQELAIPRATFLKRVGTPGEAGTHWHRFGLQPDWAAGDKARAERGELGFEPVMPGFVVRQTATLQDADGNVDRAWIQTKPEPGPAFAIPAGHVVKGVSALVNADGRETVKWIKTREADNDPRALAETLRAVMLDARGSARIDMPCADLDDDLLTVYVVSDLHLGMMAHGAECGADYDLRIASTMIRREVGRLMDMAPPSRHAVLLFLGDFFHQNDQKNATPRSGHALDVDGRWRKVYGVGARVAIGLSTAVAEKHENVEVAFLPGNHDEDAALTLAVSLELHFEEHRRITVSEGAGIHWFRRFGRCLLGATHGHTMKPDRMAMMLATDRARDWGETDYRHFFFGHIHHETAKEVGPVRVESFTSPAAKDAYAAAGGYRSGRAVNAVTFHRDRGEVCRHRVNVQAIDDRMAA